MPREPLFDATMPEHIAPAGVRVWREAMTRSLRQINATDLPATTVLDVGGGSGWLGQLVSKDASYTLLDPSPSSEEAMMGRAEAMPIRDASAALLVTVSVAQYVDHGAFAREAHRVLMPGGVLALHENGCCNPIIRLVRVAGAISAVWNSKRRAYNRTITGYLPTDPQLEGFKLEYEDVAGLFSPIATIAEAAGFATLGRILGPLLVQLDDFAFRFPWVRRWAWFRIYHFRRI